MSASLTLLRAVAPVADVVDSSVSPPEATARDGELPTEGTARAVKRQPQPFTLLSE